MYYKCIFYTHIPSSESQQYNEIAKVKRFKNFNGYPKIFAKEYFQ